MKILRIIFWVLIALFILGLFMPQDYRIERSVEISAPISKAFSLSNNLNQWPRWSPWVEQDPSIKVTVGSIAQGVGASQSWMGESGGGRLEFIESVQDKRISYNIWFGSTDQPAISTMTFEQVTANKIRVHWAIEGDMQMPIVGFIMAMLMDSLVGPSFDTGLTNLKREAELPAD